MLANVASKCFVNSEVRDGRDCLPRDGKLLYWRELKSAKPLDVGLTQQAPTYGHGLNDAM